MYLFVARVCNVSTLLVYFVSVCVWGCNHYVVRAVSEWIFWERFPTHAIHQSESKSGQEHEFVCPVVTCFFSTGIFGLINFRGQIHRYWWFIGFHIRIPYFWVMDGQDVSRHMPFSLPARHWAQWISAFFVCHVWCGSFVPPVFSFPCRSSICCWRGCFPPWRTAWGQGEREKQKEATWRWVEFKIIASLFQ